jgi:hypothetical protein
VNVTDPAEYVPNSTVVDSIFGWDPEAETPSTPYFPKLPIGKDVHHSHSSCVMLMFIFQSIILWCIYLQFGVLQRSRCSQHLQKIPPPTSMFFVQLSRRCIAIVQRGIRLHNPAACLRSIAMQMSAIHSLTTGQGPMPQLGSGTVIGRILEANVSLLYLIPQYCF